MHEVLVNCLVKHVQETSVVRRTDHPDMTIAVDWDIKHKHKPKLQSRHNILTVCRCHSDRYAFPSIS